MSNRYKLGVVLLVMPLVVISAACNRGRETAVRSATEGEADKSSDISGTYSLVTVDGHAIPYAPMHQSRQGPEVVSGTITMNSGGSFVSDISYSNSAGDAMSRDFKGTYTEEGSDYVLKWEGAGWTKVTIDGNTLTMNNEGMLFVYEK